MIVTQFYRGQGLGNQLWCYVTTRIIASKNGYAFGIQAPENFKAIDFMDLDFGQPVIGGSGPEGGPPTTLPEGITRYYQEQSTVHTSGADIRMRDERLMTISDGTKIDGLMQDAELALEHLDEVRTWLAIDPASDRRDFSSDDICIINFRGGGYVREKDFFLRSEYWQDAVRHMRERNPRFRFVVITDDIKTAQSFFPDFEVHHFSIAEDYAVIKNARNLILSNSSFAWFPASVSTDLKSCIAPKYWGRHNISDGYWSLGYNLTPGWQYLGRDGALYGYEACRAERDAYLDSHKNELVSETRFDPTEPYVPSPLRSKIAPPATVRIRRKIDTLKVLFLRRLKDASLFDAIAEVAGFVLAGIITPFFHSTPATPKVALEHRLAYRIKVVGRTFARTTGLTAFASVVTEAWRKRDWKTPAEIAAYRKTIKVYDVFTFFNELDLLEIRLNILNPVVDYFVIVEATETFSGHPKPLYFKENRGRFRKWEHKIIHFVVDDTPKDAADLRARLYGKTLGSLERKIAADTLTSDNIGSDALHWFKEFYQKESLKRALVGLADNDVCFVSDADEVWNPSLHIDFSRDNVFKPVQTGYQYYLNNRSDEDWRGWTGTIATKYKNIRSTCLGHLRTHRRMRATYVFLRHGGWHFAFLGGYEGAKRKIEEYRHDWYSSKELLPQLETRIRMNVDHRGRPVRLWVDDRGLPTYLLEHRDEYSTFFR